MMTNENLTTKELNAMGCEECGDPSCTEHEGLVLAARCHPSSGIVAIYRKFPLGCVEMYCRKCKGFVCSVMVTAE